MWKIPVLYTVARHVFVYIIVPKSLTPSLQIPQLYIHHPPSAGEPPSVLKGFTNVEVSPGQTAPVSITLSRYDLSVWDVVRQGWAKPEGTITFSVGASSRDFRLNGTIPA
jgi:beta-glucosidase